MVAARCLRVLVGLAALAGVTGAAAKAAGPNVVMILSDDQAWGDYSFMGHPQIETPNIDRLAREGRTFTRGYVPHSLCRPSLATIITGKFPHQHGIVGNNPPFPEGFDDVTAAEQQLHPRYVAVRNKYIEHIDDDLKLPEILGDRLGHVSLQTGKWWEGNFARGGFSQGMSHGEFAQRGRHGDAGLAIGRRTMKPIFEFIDQAQQDDKPFFVWYAPMMPHLSHEPPQRLLDKYKALTSSEAYAKYWAMCEWFDETIGKLLDHLEKRDLTRDTLVIYVTDNGWINAEDGSYGLPRAKMSPYDGGVRTPIIFRQPGTIEPGMETERLASSIDLVPTTLAALNLNVPAELPGINLLDATAVNGRDAVFGEIFEHDIQHMTNPDASLRFRWVVEGDWKLIVPNPAREPDAVVELFHITQDPHELKNLAGEHPEIVAKLTNRLDNWRDLNLPEATAAIQNSGGGK